MRPHTQLGFFGTEEPVERKVRRARPRRPPQLGLFSSEGPAGQAPLAFRGAGAAPPHDPLEGVWRRHAEGWRVRVGRYVAEVAREKRADGRAFYRVTNHVDGKRVSYADTTTLDRAKAYAEDQARMWRRAREARGSTSRDSVRAEVRELRRLAESQGWRVEQTRSGHWRFVPPDPRKPVVVLAGTSVSASGIRNARASLRRSGLAVDRDPRRPARRDETAEIDRDPRRAGRKKR